MLCSTCLGMTFQCGRLVSLEIFDRSKCLLISMELNRIVVQSISMHWNICLCLFCSLRLMWSQLFCSKSCSWHPSSWVRCHQSNSSRWLNSRRCFQLVNRSNWASAAKLPVENLAHHIMASCQLMETESDPQTPIACQSIHMAIFLQIGDKRNVMAKDSVKKGYTLSTTAVSL